MKLHDSYSTFPQSINTGLKYAISQYGKDKIQLEEFSHDGTLNNLDKVINSIRKFNPDIIIGGETSQFAIILANAFPNKPLFTPTASSPLISKQNSTVIRLSHMDDQYLEIAKDSLKNKACHRFGVVHNLSYPNTDSISNLVIRLLKNENRIFSKVELIKDEDIPKTFFSDLIKFKPDCVFIFSYDDDLRKVYGALNEASIHPIYIGGDGWSGNDFLKKNLLSRTEGKRFTGIISSYWNPSRKDTWFLKEKEAFSKHINKEINAFHAIGYDLGKILATANTGATISSLLENIKSTEFKQLMTSSSIRFKKNFSPIKDFYIFKIEQNVIRFEKVLRSYE